MRSMQLPEPPSMGWTPRLAGSALIVAALITALTPVWGATPPVVQTRRALDNLGQVALAWQAQFNCSGCHKQPITLLAMGTAVSRGHDAPLPGVVDALLAGTLQGTSGQNAAGCFSFGGTSNFTMSTTYAGRGLEATDRYLRSHLGPNVQGAANCLLARQEVDGHLQADSAELPVSQGNFVTTAHASQVWRRAFARTGTIAYQDAEGRALTWLRGRIAAIEAAPASFTTQDMAMLLAGLGEAGAGPSDPDVVRMRAVLAGIQLPNGSWKIMNNPPVAGNAYGTGLAVLAMRSAGFGLEDPALAAGRTWLLANQQANGAWPANDWVGGNPSLVAPSMWGALALATFPSPLATLQATGNTIAWSQVEGAESYDLIRGSVSSLAGSGGTINLGAVNCVAPAATETSAQDPSVPAPGGAFFYLFRIRWAGNRDSYGRSSDGRERLPLAGDCGP